MVTLNPGQRVLQNNNGRIWELVQPARSVEARWQIRLIEDPTGVREIGETSSPTVNWLNAHCQDVSSVVEPPKGNGVQVCRIIEPDGRCSMEGAFAGADEAIFWLNENLYPEQVGQWFGWDCFGMVESAPDLTVLSIDGELVWSE